MYRLNRINQWLAILFQTDKSQAIGQSMIFQDTGELFWACLQPEANVICNTPETVSSYLNINQASMKTSLQEVLFY